MRAGSKLYDGVEVPAHAEIKTSPKGRKYYLSGIVEENALLMFLDTKAIEKISLNTYNRF